MVNEQLVVYIYTITLVWFLNLCWVCRIQHQQNGDDNVVSIIKSWISRKHCPSIHLSSPAVVLHSVSSKHGPPINLIWDVVVMPGLGVPKLDIKLLTEDCMYNNNNLFTKCDYTEWVWKIYTMVKLLFRVSSGQNNKQKSNLNFIVQSCKPHPILACQWLSLLRMSLRYTIMLLSSCYQWSCLPVECSIRCFLSIPQLSGQSAAMMESTCSSWHSVYKFATKSNQWETWRSDAEFILAIC